MTLDAGDGRGAGTECGVPDIRCSDTERQTLALLPAGEKWYIDPRCGGILLAPGPELERLT